MNIYKEKIEIAVVAPPFSGHLYPALELVLPLLKEKDKYNICIYTGCQKEKVVKKLGFPVKVFLRDNPAIFEKISEKFIFLPTYIKNCGIISNVCLAFSYMT